MPYFVIPAKAGIHLFDIILDSRLRGNDSFIFIVRGWPTGHDQFIRYAIIDDLLEWDKSFGLKTESKRISLLQ